MPVMSDAQHELSTFIAAVRRRWQVCAMSRTLAAGVLSAAVPLAGALLLDRLSHPHGIALILLAAASILLASGLVGLTLWRMPRRPDDSRVARFIEERAAGHAALDDAIVTAVSVDGTAGGFGGLLAGAA